MVKKVFERFEEKYIISESMMYILLNQNKDKLKKDTYYESLIQNIYYDTPNYDFLKSALDKQEYKEKLRVRTYNKITKDSQVFVEIKKKSNSIVYKRRTTLSYEHYINDGITGNNQVFNEVAWLKNRYHLEPMLYISYLRHAFVGIDDSSFRITFDQNILYRNEAVSLSTHPLSKDITPYKQMVMEIKTCGSLPLWLVDFLNTNQIYPTHYSKYKACSINMHNEGVI